MARRSTSRPRVRAARRAAGAPGHGAVQGAARGTSLRLGRRSGKQCRRGARPQPAQEARRRRDPHDSRRGLRDRARMTSIRRTLLVWLLLGLGGRGGAGHAGHVCRDPARDRRALRPAVEAARVLDAHRRPAARTSAGAAVARRPAHAGVSEIVTQIWDRDGVLVYWSQPGAGLPVPVTEGYSDVVQRRAHVARLHACRRRPCAADRACARRAPRDRRAGRAAHAPAAGAADSVARRPDLVRGRPRIAPARCACRARSRCAGPTRCRRVAERALPRELQPLAASLNALLARLDEALARAAAIHGRRRARAAHAARGARSCRSSTPSAPPTRRRAPRRWPTSKPASRARRGWSSSC